MPEPTEVSTETQAEETPTPEPSPTPKRRDDWRARAIEDWRLVVAGIALVTGIVMVILGWYGAAYTNIITEQIPYLISGGLLGLGLIILAGVLAASGAQKRDNASMREELARAISALRASGGVVAGDAGSPAAYSTNGYRVFVLAGGRSFHEAGCPIIEGKPNVSEMPRAEAAGVGLTACKLCDPSS